MSKTTGPQSLLSSWKSPLVTFLLTVAAGYLVICLIAFLLQRSLIYHPRSDRLATPSDAGLEWEELRFSTSGGGSFVVWHVHHSAARLQVVYFHGNAENVSHNVDFYRLLNDLGAAVWAFEYRGYLDTKGAPSEKAITEDLVQFAEYLKSRDDLAQARFVAVGRSLGGAVAVKFASIFPVDGLILESTFSSLADVGRRTMPFLPVRLLLRDRYEAAKQLSKLSLPVLGIHSETDEVIPFDLGVKLIESATGPKEFLTIKGGHNTGRDMSWQEVTAVYADFLDKISAGARGKGPDR